MKTVQSWCRTYQKAAERQYRGECKEALASRGKWLAWDQVLAAVKAQKEAYECADGNRTRAKEGMKYGVMLLYTSLPPARSQEYWTMQWQLRSEGDLYSVEPEVPASNWLFVSQDHQHGMLYIGMHKTSRHTGVQRIELSSTGSTGALLEQLVIYCERERPLLIGDYNHKHLFVVSSEGSGVERDNRNIWSSNTERRRSTIP